LAKRVSRQAGTYCTKIIGGGTGQTKTRSHHVCAARASDWDAIVNIIDPISIFTVGTDISSSPRCAVRIQTIAIISLKRIA
jgi:hypothetical protein